MKIDRLLVSVALGSAGCAAVLGVEDLVPPAEGETTVDASIDARLDAVSGAKTVAVEDWRNGAALSNDWYGPLRDRATSSADGLCLDLVTDVRDTVELAYVSLVVAPRVVVRLDFRYILDSPLTLDDGATGVAMGFFAVASNSDWATSVRAVAGNHDADLVVDSRGLNGKAVPIPRATLGVPLRVELEGTATRLRGTLYTMQGSTPELKNAVDLTPEASLFDPSGGVRPTIVASNFFGAQRVCLTRVEVMTVDE